MTIGTSMFESTLMFCNDPTGIIEQEDAFMTALRATTVYTLDGNRLMLQYPSGVLQFEAQSTNAHAEE